MIPKNYDLYSKKNSRLELCIVISVYIHFRYTFVCYLKNETLVMADPDSTARLIALLSIDPNRRSNDVCFYDLSGLPWFIDLSI